MTLYDRISLLTQWMHDVDLKSSDPFALQCNRTTIRLSKINPKYIGHGFSLIDREFPKIADVLIEHRKAPHSVGLFVQACCLMYLYDGIPHWVNLASKQLRWLKNNANHKYHGFTWGIPFPWLMGDGVMAPENTPMSTVSPYCNDAFYLAGKYQIGLPYMITVGTSIAKFITIDLNRTYDDGDKICLSYSPLDHYQIINANAYSAAQLYRAYHYDKSRNDYKELADKMIKFILSEQNEDGSWYYWSRYNRVNEGIDSLHQSYVAQGLLRCWYENKDPAILEAVDRNIDYTLSTFLTDDFHVKKFPEQNHPYELIDAAEMIVTLNMRGKRSHAEELLDSTIRDYEIPFLPYFASRLNPRTNIPFIRWGESQMLYAMALHLLLDKGYTPEAIYL